MKNLVIIPARGGSKGIPQKNVSLLNGKPLIYYAIQNALSIPQAKVVVSTDDEKIASIASVYGAQIHHRKPESSSDKATIDDVTIEVYNDFIKQEESFETIITLQPTSPLLKASSLNKAIEQFQREDFPTLISASARRHLSWRKEDGKYYPNYTYRVNRQQLPADYEENGAFVICNAENLVKHQSRIAKNISIFELSNEESIDIDNRNDWSLAEAILQRLNLAFVCKGDVETGMGHIYRALTLATKLCQHQLKFYCPEDAVLGISKIESLNYKVYRYSSEKELLELLKEHDPDTVINDILDTDCEYIQALKNCGFKVINFEDTGSGSAHCDVLINALFEWSGQQKNTFYGYQYECLRDDIYLYPVKKEISANVKTLVVSFGGTDINNATLSILKCLNKIELPEDIEIRLILGIGYEHEQALAAELQSLSQLTGKVQIYKDVPFISKHLYEADLIISGNGRMVYEIAALATPAAIFSQNERECHHTFAKICPGLQYLGSIRSFDQNIITQQLKSLISNYEQRKQLNNKLQEFAVDIRNGLQTVEHLIINQRQS